MTSLVKRVIPGSNRPVKNAGADENAGSNGREKGVDGAEEAEGEYESSDSSVAGTRTAREGEGRDVKGGRLAAVKSGGRRRKAGRR